MIPFPNISTSPDDADSDPTNELQNISLTANALELENGGSYQSLADSDINVTLYPNPADKFVTIEIKQSAKEKTDSKKVISLNDCMGRGLIHKTIHDNFINLDLRNLDPGLYVINVIFNDKKIYKQLIKN
ncbi:MAG: T9SS type A sorting domain-containing protein [Bacteroidota bacterium]